MPPLLNTVNAHDTTIGSGGIAFRGFGATYHFDTVQTLEPVAGASLTDFNVLSAAVLTTAESDQPSSDEAVAGDGRSNLVQLVLTQYLEELRPEQRVSTAGRGVR